MKRIVVTQRVDIIKEYGERRDAIDQRWIDLLLECNLFPIFIPNNIEFVKSFILTEKFDGLLLTGGNDLVKYGGNSPERDEVERTLLEHFIKYKLPILGICRGMQLIQDYFGIKLKPISGHVATRHKLMVNPFSQYSEELKALGSVNTFHHFATKSTVKELIVGARTSKNIIMQIEHKNLPIYGQMWHSEREFPFVDAELNLFRKIFCSNKL